MKTLVAIKQVPARDAQFRADGSGRALDESELSFEMNEPDAYALEAALQLRESHAGEVVAVSAGPPRVESALREALAKGADRAIHVVVDDPSRYDTFGLAALLAGAMRAEQPDLVLTGLQSDDLGNGQTGVVLAELLGAAHTTLAVALELDGATLRVKRELEGGWYQRVALTLPAVVSVQSGIHRLRYATLMGIKKAKTKELRTVSPDVEPGPGVRLLRLDEPRRSSDVVWLQGTAEEQAAQLVDRLRTEAHVL